MAVLLRSGSKRKRAMQSDELASADCTRGILDLPNEILEHVIQFVPLSDRIWLACACKHLLEFIQSSPRLLLSDGKITGGTTTYTLSMPRMDVFLRLSPPERVRRDVFRICVGTKRSLVMLDRICKTFPVKEYAFLIDTDHVAAAINNDSLPVLKWLIETWREGHAERMRGNAQPTRQTTLINFVLHFSWPSRQNSEWYVNTRADVCAAKTGNLEILQWIAANNNQPFSVREVLREASYKGHLHVIKWVAVKYNAWDRMYDVCEEAVIRGYTQIVEFVLEHCVRQTTRFGVDRDLMCSAIRGGKLEIVKLLRANGSPWGTWTYVEAFRHNRMDILNYLYSAGCPFSRESVDTSLADPDTLERLLLDI